MRPVEGKADEHLVGRGRDLPTMMAEAEHVDSDLAASRVVEGLSGPEGLLPGHPTGVPC
jgi:hypothetical protein